MSEPLPHLTGAQIERLLADLCQQSGSLSADDLHRLEELVNRVGGIEAAQELFATLEDLDLDEEALEQMADEEIDLEEDDIDDDEDDLEQLAA